MIKKSFVFLFVGMLLSGCKTLSEMEQSARHFRKYKDYASLRKVVDLLPLGTNAREVHTLLGKATDMGFDLRYPLDSLGPDNCIVGAVFHLDENRKIDQKWLDQICE